MFAWIKRLFKKEVEVILSVVEKIDHADQRIENAFQGFKTLHDEVENVNNILLEVVIESQKEYESLKARLGNTENRIVSTVDKINANKGLQVRIADFIPQK